MQEEHKQYISKLSDSAEKEIANIKIGDVIRFINNNIQNIFDEDNVLHDMRFVTLDIIAKYNNGISINTFEYKKLTCTLGQHLNICNDTGLSLENSVVVYGYS